MGSTARLPLSIQPVNSISIAEKAGSIGNFFKLSNRLKPEDILGGQGCPTLYTQMNICEI